MYLKNLLTSLKPLAGFRTFARVISFFFDSRLIKIAHRSIFYLNSIVGVLSN